jgi:RND family efflux transporter MFP subunit
MKMSRTSRAWTLGIATAAALAVGATQNQRKEATEVRTRATHTATATALTVSVVHPERVEWPEMIQASGTIAPWQEAIVGVEIVGLRLADLLVEVGDEVTKGQVLARFDDATTLAMVRQSEAAVAEAEANVAEADANAQRAERLGRTGALSQQDATQYLTRGRTAKAQLESSKARLHSQQLALQYTRVVAPDDGVISSRKAMLGMVAAPGTELFRLVRQNRLEWRAELSGAQLVQVRIGDAATVQLADGTMAHGKVRQIAPVLDESRRIGVAYVELDRSDGGNPCARAGMYGTGAITLGHRDALTLPSDAIVMRDGHEYVFVLGADDRVVLTRVAIGRRFGNGVEISTGVTDAQQVVAAGAAFLNDADAVRTVPALATVAAGRRS